MSIYENLETFIQENIKSNGQGEITGQVLQDVLLEMIKVQGQPENITWEELVALRDSDNLTPGRLYRITDYTTTTTQDHTQSAGHPFDVVVLALSESELSERAWAIHSVRDIDEYFANSNLSAWHIWYCLDNDTSRFDWADTESGKGVIYRMIDEWNNDCPYDFKNIQFTHPFDIAKYPGFYYTFSTPDVNSPTDYSLANGERCYCNTMGEAYLGRKQRTLNRNVFILDPGSEFYYNNYGSGCYSNSCRNSCFRNTFGPGCRFIALGLNTPDGYVNDPCRDNIFGADCHRIDLKRSCGLNIFSPGCYGIELVYSCFRNTFGQACYNIKLYDSCMSNNFGEGCYDITMRSTCTNNSFGRECYDITIYDGSYANYFGENCYNIEMGLKSHTNNFYSRNHDIIMGERCFSNTFRQRCSIIRLGAHCYSNYFGIACTGISFRVGELPSDNLREYCFFCHFEDGVEHINLYNGETASSNNGIRRYFVSSGRYGTSSSPGGVNVLNLDIKYKMTVAKDSSENIKQFCIADLA